MGLDTALGVLKSGFVIVGSFPTPGGTLVSPQPPGSLLILDKNGNVVEALSDNKLLDGPIVTSMTQIASGYKHEPNATALVVGPTGLAYDPESETLYVWLHPPRFEWSS